MSFTEDELAALETLAGDTRRGPWELYRWNEDHVDLAVVGPREDRFVDGDSKSTERPVICYVSLPSDAAFIAAARAAVPALIAEVRLLRKERNSLMRMIRGG